MAYFPGSTFMQLKRIANLIACNSYIPQRRASRSLWQTQKRGWFIPTVAAAAVSAAHYCREENFSSEERRHEKTQWKESTYIRMESTGTKKFCKSSSLICWKYRWIAWFTFLNFSFFYQYGKKYREFWSNFRKWPQSFVNRPKRRVKGFLLYLGSSF